MDFLLLTIRNSSMTFWFQSLKMAFHYFQDDVYLIVSLKEHTVENATAIERLEKLVSAQGLFLLQSR